jgi:aspartate ammonia-lyase
MASEAGQLQLNAFEPIMGWSLHKSIRHLSNACITLEANCVAGIEANHELLARRVRESVTLVTALNPIIGYEKAALIAKTAIASGASIDDVAQSLGILTREQMEALLVPEKLTEPLRLVVTGPARA